MAEKEKTLVDQIEKLIVDGNKEILRRLDGLENGQMTLEAGQRALEVGQKTLEEGQKRLEFKVDKLSGIIDATAKASYGLLTDVRNEVKEVKDTLNKHVRLPAHA
jgi:exonuclease VII small subunit